MPTITAEQFAAQHRVAKRLGPKQLAFAMSLADRHEKIKIYSRNGDVFLSREAMYTPGVREPFYVRRKGQPKE